MFELNNQVTNSKSTQGFPTLRRFPVQEPPSENEMMQGARFSAVKHRDSVGSAKVDSGGYNMYARLPHQNLPTRNASSAHILNNESMLSNMTRRQYPCWECHRTLL